MERIWLNDRMVDLTLNRIDDQPVDARAMAVLQVLLENAPDPVSTETLLHTVWHDRVVGDNVVHQAIASVRRALGDSAGTSRFIETIPRKGYRLIAWVGASRQRSDWRSAMRLAGRRWLPGLVAAAAVGGVASWMLSGAFERDEANGPRRVAVLELSDLSAGDDLGWLAGGVTLELRRQIGAMEGYEVVPPGDVTGRLPPDLKQATELVLHGALQREADKVRVILELTDLQRDSSVWREVFHGRSEDPMTLQQQIATSVSRYFQRSLLSLEGPANAEAYWAYLHYLHHQWGGDPDEEKRWLEQALKLDPDWWQGWGDLAWLNQQFASWYRDVTYLARSRLAIDHMRQILGPATPRNPQEVTLAAFWEGNPVVAEPVLRDWIRRHDDVGSYARLMLTAGLCAEAEPLLERSVEQAPYAIGNWDQLAQSRTCQGNYVGAIEASERGLRLMAGDSFRAGIGLIVGLPRSGRLQEARTLADQLTAWIAEREPDSTEAILLERFRHWLGFEIARAEDDHEGVQRELDWMRLQGHTMYVALGLLLSGADGAAVEMDRVAREPLSYAFVWTWLQALLPPELQAHPSVVALRARMGFGPDTRLELCRRAASLPVKVSEPCDPARYATDNLRF